MGKTTILPFIYDGSFDFYVRIAHSNIRGKWNHTTYVGKYFSKREHTLRRRCVSLNKMGCGQQTQPVKLNVG